MRRIRGMSEREGVGTLSAPGRVFVRIVRSAGTRPERRSPVSLIGTATHPCSLQQRLQRLLASMLFDDHPYPDCLAAGRDSSVCAFNPVGITNYQSRRSVHPLDHMSPYS